ncbi:hypothetical protein HanPSC8_Chr01g0006711 [Helianthus annuus]|nr:hypothetical protein HanPSC8_Chr01g0006711 [Helianthus annuus]
MNHLCTRIRLLIVISQRNRIKLTNRIITLQHNTRVLPSNRRPRFHLGPRNLGFSTRTETPFRHKIINPTSSIFIPSIPILHRRVLDLSPLVTMKFHHSSMKLIRVVGRGRTPL